MSMLKICRGFSFLFTCISLVQFGTLSFAVAEVLADIPLKKERKSLSEVALKDKFTTWSYFRSYVPVKRDYGIEVGGMWEKNNLYWVGGNAGFHVGRCMFTQSHSCQQYMDIIGGVGGRNGLTNGLIAGSVRWQFISYPNKYSPFARLYVGAMNIRDDDRDENSLAYGVGYGLSASVHRRVDLKFELRVGEADQTYSMAFLSMNLKVDSLVGFFADQIKQLKEGTVKATGKVIKGTFEAPGKVIRSTIEAPGQIIDWVQDPVLPGDETGEQTQPKSGNDSR